MKKQNAHIVFSSLFFMLTVLIGTGCSKDVHDPTNPIVDFHVFTANLSNLDTITPPFNPLQPMDPQEEGYPVFIGYLDFAKYSNGERYCALIGLKDNGETVNGREFIYSGNVYILLDEQGEPIRGNSPLLAELKIGEVIYVGGWAVEDSKNCLGIIIKQIQSTGKCLTYDDLCTIQVKVYL